MVSHDALAAAKAAALQQLAQRTSEPSSRSTRKRPRRRTRPKPQPSQQNGDVPKPKEAQHTAPAAADLQYVPETIDHVLAAARTEDGARSDALRVSSAALDEIALVMKRFEERGRPEINLEMVVEEVPPVVHHTEKQNETREGEEQRLDRERDNDYEHDIDVSDDVPDNALEPHANKPNSVSRKQRKELQRNLISRLKSFSDSPDIVESWDITAPDPFLLVHLKAWPNSVPVPVNWRQKRKYLQNKRGMEKRAFKLPPYIIDTGVGELRDAQIEADEKKSLKQRQREKMRAKTGRGVEIDHGRLHDAFFKFQVKPRLTPHGDLYYELRELEVDHSKFRPGVLSDALRAALDMADGDPPPWLVNMQRYGPPPGYPGLNVPGLNAPIPAGARFGYQPGGWGKPPVDANGRPLYGDVFGEGIAFGQRDGRFDLHDHQKSKLWGGYASATDGLSVRVRSAEDEDEEERESGDEAEPVVKPAPSHVQSEQASNVISKERVESSGPEDVRKGIPSGQLYTVLEQRRVSVQENAMMGSSHAYNVNETGGARGTEDQREGGQKRRKESEGKESGRIAKKQKQFKF